MADKIDAFHIRGPDGVVRGLDEHYGGMKDVEEDAYGAWLAIQNLWQGRDEAYQRGYAQAVEDAAAAIRRCASRNPEGAPGDEALRQAHYGVEALTPPTPAPVVSKVKPLVWYDKPDGQEQRIGRSDQVAYSVRFDMGAWGYTRQGERGHTISRKGGAYFRDEADAMSGADADHEARVLSQLDMAPVTVQEAARVAVLFHETYEKLAPKFGYETRQDTRAFDPESVNGRLMIATCREVLRALAEQEGE